MNNLIFSRQRLNGTVQIVFFSVILLTVTALQAQQVYEDPAMFPASKILPPEVLAGPDHRVDEAVYNDGYLNIYTVNSRFGNFRAVSDGMLDKRINEIRALGQLEEISRSDAFTSGLTKSMIL